MLAVAALLVGMVASGLPAGAHSGGTVRGFENPESAAWDKDTGGFFVSNMGPGPIDPLGREPDGYLSKISAAGQLETAKWVTGLRSPKGIHRRGDDLLVADVGQLVVIDVAGAKIRRTIDLDGLGAKFPNDVTVDDRTGDAYVSDTGRNAIFRLPAGGSAAEVWLESDKLDGPNGLFLDGGTLMVASYGQDPDGDGPAARSPGRIMAVDLGTKAIHPLGDMAPLGNLDGLEKLDSDWIVTGSGRVWKVTPDGKATELAQVANAADLGLRRGDRVAAVATLSDNTVEFVTIGGGAGGAQPPPAGAGSSRRAGGPRQVR
jgi:DNA-binding beta-propeller fold protein YncE